MVKNVIVHPKYVFKETLFEFWGRLEKNEQKLQWDLLLNNKLCVNELSIETPGTKKYIKKDWRKARKSYVPSILAPDTVAPNIYPLKYIYSEWNQRLPGNSLLTFSTAYSSLF